METATATSRVNRQSDGQPDLMALIDQANRATDGSMVVPGDYLEIVIAQ